MSAAAAAAPAPAKKLSTSKLVIVLAAVAVSGAVGGVSAWFLMGRGAAHAEAKVEEKKPRKSVFTTLEPFTVNLQDARGERFAQIGVTIEHDDPAIEVQIKDRLPAVRNDILLLISSKQIEQLLSVDGKQQLADQIRERVARAIGAAVPAAAASGASGASGASANAGPIRGVLFSQFIVQ
ncbi:flagellar basal body-associated FliL family protein [Ramlibacter sp.]|uniref:flagellar basal body-associated FliL family protein n=1 Tax=Ramlibacter sp. TaxID=1917967 RepID=UPI003D0BCEF1